MTKAMTQHLAVAFSNCRLIGLNRLSGTIPMIKGQQVVVGGA